jgi:hypothetical protein
LGSFWTLKENYAVTGSDACLCPKSGTQEIGISLRGVDGPLPPVRWLAAVGVIAVFLVAFFFAPVVGYSQSIFIPDDYQPGAYAACSGILSQSTTTVTGFVTTQPNASQIQEFNNCMNDHLYPGTVVGGRATLAYRLLGIGAPPFPNEVGFSSGNYSALVFFNGTEPVSAYEFYSSSVDFGPRDTVEIVNASVRLSGYGVYYFSGAVKNIGNSTITSLNVFVNGVPGSLYSSEGSRSLQGIEWYFGAPNSVCSVYLKPGLTCDMYSTLRNQSLPAGQLRFTLLVTGAVDGRLFAYTQDFSQASPQPGLNADWMSLFVGKVNQERQGPALTENSTLDRFAALRFKTASSQPQISDYGLAVDAASFFGSGGGGAGLEELVMYPGAAAPYVYVTELQGSAPLHWSALINSSFTQFGYFIGSAPYYYIPANCPVQELPAAGINVTQYFQQYGCSTTLEQASWLVVVLGR